MQNTNNELVSVIVPVYKVEPYLDRCVASILAQTYPNLEVILVDDGSPDNCPALCDAWAQRDARIRVIHKKNGGQSDARNVGLDAASGSFLRRIPTHVMHGINYANGNCLTPSGFRSVALWKILALHTRSCSTQGRSCTRTNPCITIISAMAALSIQTV